jgi:phosphoserine phosphatase RsbU/P
VTKPNPPTPSNHPGPVSQLPRVSQFGQRTIGLLADWFDEHYQLTILRTVEEAVAQRGSSLLSFAGGIPGSSRRHSQQRHAAFELIRPSNVDGAILLAGTMVNELGTEALARLVEQLRGLPLCAIGIEVPGVPSILVDNQSGIDQAMTHLVERHGSRRVAFIRGPAKNKEAESRFAAYQAALGRANIPFDAALVFQGDFLQASGEQAVQTWLATGTEFDAIFAANDEMALGALHALTAAGRNVPSDVALIGFDDMEGARNASPPLTTVRQPLKDIAVAAVRTIMDQLQGREVPRMQMLQTHLVLRESCGCSLRLSSTGQSLHPDVSPTSSPIGFAQAFSRRKQSLKAELQRAARGEFQGLGAWEDRLIASFAAEMDALSKGQGAKDATGESVPAGEFLEQLSQFVSTVAQADGDVTRWHDVVTAFRRYSIPCVGTDLELYSAAEDLLQDARMATAYAVERHEARKRMTIERFTRQLVNVGSALTGTFDLTELSRAIQSELPALGITACYVAVYEPFGARQHTHLPELARLVAAFDNGFEVTAIGEQFRPHQLAPTSCWPPPRQSRFTVLPLFLKGAELGFALVESKTAPGAVLEFVREQLSIALFGASISR